MKPDFLIIPFEIHEAPGLRPIDAIIYAVVYWFEHLRDGKCTASNTTISEIVGCAERVVRRALDNLERKGFIERVYIDPETKNNRSEIRTLVRFRKKTEEPKVYRVKTKIKAKDLGKMEPGSIMAIPAEEIVETPGEFSRNFFRHEEGQQNAHKHAMLEELMAMAPGADRRAVIAEMQKFIAYWTEPNKSGTKVKWELERTFDVKRRLITWLTRAGKYNAQGRTRAGAGVTV